MKVLIFDTETTGLPKKPKPNVSNTNKWPHIIQLSYILFDTVTNDIIEIFDEIIKLGADVEISEGSVKIHGITRSKSNRSGICIKKALDHFKEALAQAECIVGHNLLFDKEMIMVESNRVNQKQYFSKKKEFCTMKNGKTICKIERQGNNGDVYFKYPSLSELHVKLFKHTPKGTHDSMADVLICLRCYIYMTQSKDINKCGSNNFRNLYTLYCV